MLNYSLKPSYEYQVRVFGTGVVTRTTELLVHRYCDCIAHLWLLDRKQLPPTLNFMLPANLFRWFQIVNVIFMGSNIHCCLLKWIACFRLSYGDERTR